MWQEATRPLAACLERAHEGTVTLQEIIPMLQNALILMGGCLSTSIIILMKEGLVKGEDFVAAQPFLLGEDFGSVVKRKLKAAGAALSTHKPVKESRDFREAILTSSAVEMGQPSTKHQACPWEIQEGNQLKSLPKVNND